MSSIQNNKQRAFDGVFIPAEIWLDTELKPLKKLLLAEIKSLDNDFGCIANNQHFATFLDCSKQWVSDVIQELKEMGYIFITYKDSKTFEGRTIKVNKAKYYKLTTPTEKPEGATEKPEHNKTFNNTFNRDIEKPPINSPASSATQTNPQPSSEPSQPSFGFHNSQTIQKEGGGVDLADLMLDENGPINYKQVYNFQDLLEQEIRNLTKAYLTDYPKTKPIGVAKYLGEQNLVKLRRLKFQPVTNQQTDEFDFLSQDNIDYKQLATQHAKNI